MSKQRRRSAVDLPRGVHRVTARGRDYFYYQPGRGTVAAGDRIRLPSDAHSPEFWTALRQAQGITGAVATDTIDALIDGYIAAWPTLPQKLADGTQRLYRRNLNRARRLWASCRPGACGLSRSGGRRTLRVRREPRNCKTLENWKTCRLQNQVLSAVWPVWPLYPTSATL